MEPSVPRPEWKSALTQSPWNVAQFKQWIIWDPPSELGLDPRILREIITAQLEFQIDTKAREVELLKVMAQSLRG